MDEVAAADEVRGITVSSSGHGNARRLLLYDNAVTSVAVTAKYNVTQSPVGHSDFNIGF
jgi:hypothetical protein